MLNFLLAIIVDGYVKVAKALDEQETENDFFSDVAASVHAAYLQRRNRWPNLRLLADFMEEEMHDRIVCYGDLHKGLPPHLAFGSAAHAQGFWRAIGRSNLQPPDSDSLGPNGAGIDSAMHFSIISFIQHYGCFDCLLEPDEGDALFEQIKLASGKLKLFSSGYKAPAQGRAVSLLKQTLDKKLGVMGSIGDTTVTSAKGTNGEGAFDNQVGAISDAGAGTGNAPGDNQDVVLCAIEEDDGVENQNLAKATAVGASFGYGKAGRDAERAASCGCGEEEHHMSPGCAATRMHSPARRDSPRLRDECDSLRASLCADSMGGVCR